MKLKRFLKVSLISLAAFLVAFFLGRELILRANTDIPKLYFEGDLSEMKNKKDIRHISVTYRDGVRDFEGFAEIKLQGTSSLAYNKKNYTITLFRDEGHEEKLKVDMGWGAQSKYCLKANWIDRTHARNVVTARLVTQAQQQYNVLPDAPRNGAIDGFPVEIYLNGRFFGLYTLNIPKDEWMFNMDGDNPNHIVLCGEGWDNPNYFRAEPDFESWAVEVGEESPETLAKVSRLFDFIMNSSDEEFRQDFGKYLDLDAALNYYVFTDVAYMIDNRGKNMLLATYDGQKWFLQLYDLDSCWGSSTNGREIHYDVDAMPGIMDKTLLFERLADNFAPELATRYFELREGVLSRENILREFRAFREEIPTLSFVKENLRWGPVIRGFGIKQIETFLDDTTQARDQRYEELGRAG